MVYSFGTELERPQAVAFLGGQFGNDVCPVDLPDEDPSLFDLIDTRSHNIQAFVGYWIDKKTAVRGGYGISLRFSGRQVHTFTSALQRWF